MAKFSATRLKKAFNKAVVAHKASGLVPSQVRPKIHSIGPKDAIGQRQLTYQGFSWAFNMGEADIAAIVHSYTLLVAGFTGDQSLIEDTFFKE